MKLRMLSTVTALGLLAFTRESSAQTLTDLKGGFALQQFDPAPVGDHFFQVNDAAVRGHMRPAIQLLGNYALRPLKLRDSAADTDKGYVTETQLYAHIGASLTLYKQALVHVDIPIAIAQSGDNLGSSGVSTPSGGKLADVRLGGRFAFFGTPKDPASLALGLDVWLPTGSTDNLTGDGKPRFQPKLLFSGQSGMFVYAANTGVLVRGIFRDLGNAEVGTAFTFAAAAGVRVADDKLQVGPELYGNTVFGQKNDLGATSDTPAFGVHSTPLELLIGAKVFAGDFVFGAGAGPGLSKAPGTPVLRGVLSAAWVPRADPPPPDSDGDGIIDQNDACKDVKGVATNDPKTNGCPPPPPPPDTDKDGIIDELDKCPTVPGVASTDPARNGCPADKDGDTILDQDDACPDEPGIASEDKSLNGCADTDKDGIFDKLDACKTEPGKASQDPKFNGCPDKDGDGIFDSADACPDAPGKPSEDPKKNGCPLALLVGTQIRITEQVEFDTGKSTIKPASADLLKKVGDILRDNPGFTLIRVEGHTDNKGNKGNNQILSKQRADAVKKWLTEKEKIDAKRLTTAGFGQDKPIDTNDTEAGRQNNRRVEFHVEKQTDPNAPATPAPATPAKPPVAAPAKPAPAPAKPAPAPAKPAPKKP